MFPMEQMLNTSQSIRNLTASPSRILIYQYGDLDSVKEHQWYLDSVQSYAENNSYSYMLDVFDREQALAWIHVVREFCVEHVVPDKSGKLQGLKPFTLFRQISAISSQFDWVVYLDLDVFIADTSRTLESIIQSKLTDSRQYHDQAIVEGSKLPSPSAGEFIALNDCFVMVQDNTNTLNTGFLMFSTQDLGLLNAFVDDWIQKWFMLTNVWDGDQIAFQYSIFDLAQVYFRVPEESRQSYEEDCSFDDAHGANICFDRFMTGLGLRFRHRSFGDVCIIPARTRINMHNHYRKGDFLFHGRHKERYFYSTGKSAWMQRM
jgi:hypothetical protein